MMTRMTLILSLSALPLVFAEEAVERLTQANKVFEEIMATPDKGIPRELVAKAKLRGDRSRHEESRFYRRWSVWGRCGELPEGSGYRMDGTVHDET